VVNQDKIEIVEVLNQGCVKIGIFIDGKNKLRSNVSFSVPFDFPFKEHPLFDFFDREQFKVKHFGF